MFPADHEHHRNVSREGVWAYDSLLDERVLLRTCVLAFLGDNPMQSEFACHIGLRGKFCCRVCDVGSWCDDDNDDSSIGSVQSGDSVLGDDDRLIDGPRSSVNDDDETQPLIHSNSHPCRNQKPKKVKVKVKETVTDLARKVKGLMQIGNTREKRKTKSVLQEIRRMAREPRTKTERAKLKTDHGIKDKFLDFFISKIDAISQSIKGNQKRGEKSKRDAIKEAHDNLPTSCYNAALRLSGMDVHTDTPVEILHTILLGILKYFWRHVINVLSDSGKEKLKIRLYSMDVHGLHPDLTLLNGKTLVQYAGSLVGRDFRHIVQVAPFVLHDLVDIRVYEAWLALAKVARLAWQPDIPDISQYKVRQSNLRFEAGQTDVHLERSTEFDRRATRSDGIVESPMVQ